MLQILQSLANGETLLACAVAIFRRTWNWLAGCGIPQEDTDSPFLPLFGLLQRLHNAILARPTPGWDHPTPDRRPLPVRLSMPLTAAAGRSKAGFRLCFWRKRVGTDALLIESLVDGTSGTPKADAMPAR